MSQCSVSTYCIWNGPTRHAVTWSSAAFVRVSGWKVPLLSINSWLAKGDPDPTSAPAYGQWEGKDHNWLLLVLQSRWERSSPAVKWCLWLSQVSRTCIRQKRSMWRGRRMGVHKQRLPVKAGGYALSVKSLCLNWTVLETVTMSLQHTLYLESRDPEERAA